MSSSVAGVTPVCSAGAVIEVPGTPELAARFFLAVAVPLCWVVIA